jgi:type I restriction-modification system DNA methylase subunit
MFMFFHKLPRLLSSCGRITDISPEEKKKIILSQFQFIKDRVVLNEGNEYLDMTPLKYFALEIKEKVRHGLKQNIDYDVLGKFYSEFIRYSGGDGKGLGIVLTPSHVTQLFSQLLEVKPSDIVLDTCVGTAGFLISAMNEMIRKAKDEDEVGEIKKHRLHGIELREDLYTIATTNMILRGDGKSNLRRGDYSRISNDVYKKIGATVGMLNPPYSQAKNRETQHLAEINFIIDLLDRLEAGGRGAAIVPQSVTIGKSRYEKDKKAELLRRHSLEAVITMPKETFYPTGTNPVIAIFTAHVPHNFTKRVKFINFHNDGFVKHKTLGRIPTEITKDKIEYLLDVYFDRVDAPTSFMIKSEIKEDDEWLHAFYYFNDEIPPEEMFKNKLSDYLTFKFDQTIRDRDYLFKEDGTKVE